MLKSLVVFSEVNKNMGNKMKKQIKAWFIAAGLCITAINAQAALIEFEVQARENSSTGGVGLDTGISFEVGDVISGFTDEDDLWNAGALPRWSNANDLTGDLFATGSDE